MRYFFAFISAILKIISAFFGVFMSYFFDVLHAALIIVVLCFLAYKIDVLTYRIDRMNGCLCQTDSECEVYDYGG
jgi:ABC-type Mn2+/Zn2+ transport system permease subunit